MRDSRSATARLCEPLLRSFRVGLMGMMTCGLALGSAVDRPPGTNESALRDLHRIGVEVSNAVLSKNALALLKYSRPDLRSEEEIALKDEKSDLYCYIFDTRCLKGRRSVYDKLSSATRLGQKIRILGKSPDGQLYGILFFYDSASIPDRLLRSNDFLCKESAKRIASWEFKLVDGRWESAHPLFDAETDTLCNE
jgi:hypothetical protein